MGHSVDGDVRAADRVRAGATRESGAMAEPCCLDYRGCRTGRPRCAWCFLPPPSSPELMRREVMTFLHPLRGRLPLTEPHAGEPCVVQQLGHPGRSTISAADRVLE